MVADLRGTKNQFEDPDFKPSQSSIFNDKDDVPVRDSVQLERLKWVRTKDIPIKSDLVGFYDYNSKMASQAEEGKLVGLELADSHRVFYG